MAGGDAIVLSVSGLTKTYRTAGEQIAVLRGINLDVAAGDALVFEDAARMAAIAVNTGRAARLLDVRPGDELTLAAP